MNYSRERSEKVLIVTERIYSVKIAEIITRKSPAILECVLGSCVGIVFYDPTTKTGSLAHSMLPTIKKASRMSKRKLNPAKYVDSAIEIQLKKLNSLGVRKSNLVAKLVGGAQMFTFQQSIMNIGTRNIELARTTVAETGIPVVGEDLGKTFGRRIRFILSSGKIEVMKAGGQLWKII